MTPPAPLIDTWLSITLAAVALGSAVKSGYNGYIDRYVFERLRKAEKAHERTIEIEERVDEIQGAQEIQMDATIQIGEIVGGINGHDFDSDQYREEIGREEADRFISTGGNDNSNENGGGQQ